MRWILCFLIVFSIPSPGATVTYRGDATTLEGTFAYQEKHQVTFKDGRVMNTVTKYFDKDGRAIAELTSDYSRSVKMPTYEFRDFRLSYSEGLRYRDGSYYIYSQKKGADIDERPFVAKSDQVFSCQGWHYFLVNNLEVFNKKDVHLNLILPSEYDALPFKIARQPDKGDSLLRVKLTLDHWLFKFFAPELDLVYSPKAKKLVEFRGVSNIKTDDGERQDVRIVYDYGDVGPKSAKSTN